MPQNGHEFLVVENMISNVQCHADGLLGIVKVQMPEQCQDNGTFFRIRDRERERNLRIVQNTITTYGHWAQQINAPTIILFPELSVSEEATDWLRNEMANASISPNTLIALGLEHLSTTQFTDRVSDSDSCTNFANIDFGPNIDRVNTAVIIAKNNTGNVFCYYQPKCSRSDYEPFSQYTSSIINKFAFGQHHFIVNICSDFFLQAGARPLVGSVLLNIDQFYTNPSDHRLDLILLIQKNCSPLDDLYHDSVKCLFYNTPHHISTSDTIICAVNSANHNDPGKYGKSNVSVMRRGRPPVEYKERHAHEHFAWCSHNESAEHLNDNLHYARWRMRCAGAISFILDTSRRPWPPGNLESMPINNPGLRRLTNADTFETVHPIPEVYELQEVLYRDFQFFIDACFQVNELRYYFGPVVYYEDLLKNLFTSSPIKIIELLLILHNVPVNCDHWDMDKLTSAFKHFLLTLRLLSERYDDLCVLEEQLHADTRTIGVMDCEQRSFVAILSELKNPAIAIQNIDVLLLQRISELYPLWDGAPTGLEELQNSIKTNRPTGTETVLGSISRAPSPQIADVGFIISMLNREYLQDNDIRRVLNDILRFA